MPVTLRTEAEPWPGGTGAPADPTLPTVPDAPDLGRTARVVGPVMHVDMNQSPHPKRDRECFQVLCAERGRQAERGRDR